MRCTEFQLPGDVFPGFGINWFPLPWASLYVLFFVAVPCSPLSCFPSRLWAPAGPGSFSAPLDCAPHQGWAHRRWWTNANQSIHVALHVPCCVLICCLHDIYLNSLGRVGPTSHISHVSSNPVPPPWFLVQISTKKGLSELIRKPFSLCKQLL